MEDGANEERKERDAENEGRLARRVFGWNRPRARGVSRTPCNRELRFDNK